MSDTRRFIWIFILLFINVLLALTEFPYSIILSSIRLVLFIVSIVICFRMAGWKWKIGGLLFVVSFTMIRRDLNLWKYKANNHISLLLDNHQEIIDRLGELEHISYISRSLEHQRLDARPSSRHRAVDIMTSEDSIGIINFINHTPIQEIFMNQEVLLFSMRRFIDNGYGLAFINPLGDTHPLELFKSRISGMEVRSIIRIREGWYVVSYT